MVAIAYNEQTNNNWCDPVSAHSAYMDYLENEPMWHMDYDQFLMKFKHNLARI